MGNLEEDVIPLAHHLGTNDSHKHRLSNTVHDYQYIDEKLMHASLLTSMRR
jgi:hypothetical protein